MSNMTFEQYLKMYTEQLADHELFRLQDMGPVRAWYLKSPGGTRMMSTLFTFTFEGIVVMGDFCPNGHGAISAYGYGLAWFVGVLAPDYLAEKFLPRAYHEDDAEDWFRWELEQVRGEIEEHRAWPGFDADDMVRLVDRREAIKEILDGGDFTEAVVLTQWHEYALDCEDFPGHTHSRSDMALLSAIQQRFRELFWERYERIDADGNPVEREAP